MNGLSPICLQAAPSVGQTRERYAFLPVRRYSTPRPFIAPEGWFWLTKTTQTRTISEGWLAFADDNQNVRLLSDRGYVTLSITTLSALISAVVWTALPIVTWALPLLTR